MVVVNVGLLGFWDNDFFGIGMGGDGDGDDSMFVDLVNEDDDEDKKVVVDYVYYDVDIYMEDDYGGEVVLFIELGQQ